jgi:hypothetical protein
MGLAAARVTHIGRSNVLILRSVALVVLFVMVASCSFFDENDERPEESGAGGTGGATNSREDMRIEPMSRSSRQSGLQTRLTR